MWRRGTSRRAGRRLAAAAGGTGGGGGGGRDTAGRGGGALTLLLEKAARVGGGGGSGGGGTWCVCSAMEAATLASPVVESVGHYPLGWAGWVVTVDSCAPLPVSNCARRALTATALPLRHSGNRRLGARRFCLPDPRPRITQQPGTKHRVALSQRRSDESRIS